MSDLTASQALRIFDRITIANAPYQMGFLVQYWSNGVVVESEVVTLDKRRLREGF